jgi:hypothetical protein
MQQWKMTTMILALIAANSPALHGAGKPAPGDAAQNGRRQAMIEIVRQVNVSEIEEQTANGRFAELKALAKSTGFRAMGIQLPAMTELQVYADPEGKHFVVRLKDTKDACLFTIFSDETGIVYAGQTAQCE